MDLKSKPMMMIGALAVAVLVSGLTWAFSDDLPRAAVAQSAPQDMSTTAQEVAPSTILDELSKDEIQVLIMASGQNAIKSAIAHVAPAVVQIDVTRSVGSIDGFRGLEDLFGDPNSPFKEFFEQMPQIPQIPNLPDRFAQGVGSGVFVEFNGEIYLLSNNHVVQGAESIQVTTQQGDQFSAEVIGSDTMIDLAVLKVSATEGQVLPTAVLGDSDSMEIGDWVVAIGSPLGLSHTVTAGIVSAMQRDVNNPQGTGRFRALIQTDAAINPGNSGGPLVNAKGQIVGINTLIANNSEGLNFAININEVKRALPQLIADGKLTRAWLGVFIQELDGALAQQFGVEAGSGVLVSDIIEESPSLGVLESGDVITQVNGEAVGTMTELQDAIMFKAVGEAVTLMVVRDGEPMTLEVTLGQRPQDGQAPAQPQSDTGPVEKFGLQVQALTPELAEGLGIESEQGVVVGGVAPNSRAFWADPQPQAGDLVVEVNRRDIASIDDWNEAVSQLEDDAQVVFTLMRDGRTFFVALP